MAKIERYSGNLVPFASDSQAGERYAFGTSTADDTLDNNINTEYKRGFGIIGPNDFPPLEWFNAANYTISKLVSYLYQVGIAEWTSLQEYHTNSICIGSDGNIYKSTVDNNTGNNPVSDSVNWSSAFDSANFVDKTSDESIDGIKSFLNFPITPSAAPATDYQVANKKYVDDLALPIGTILNGYTIFDNCIVAFGGEFNRADYPKLWAYLQSNLSLLKTELDWQSESTANGGICGFFSDGDGTTTFRVPNLDKAFLRPDSRGVGSFQEGSYITGDDTGTSPTPVGLVSHDDQSSLFRQRMNWDSLAPVQIGNSNLKFASYGTNAGTGTYQVSPSTFGVARPKNIAVLPLIVAK